MRFILTILCLLFSHQTFAEISLSDNVEVYQGEGNLTVTTVRVLPLNSNKALLEISGIDHELSGLVLNYDINLVGGNRRLNTNIYGRSHNSFVEQSGWGGKSQTLYIPGQREGFYLYFDSEASKSAKPSTILKKHKKQIEDGVLLAVQRFDRKREESQINAKLADTEKKLHEACGKTIQYTTKWESIGDETIKGYSVSGYCGEAMKTVQSLCSNESKKEWVKKSIDTISCEFGESLRLNVGDKKMVFKTAVDEPNQSDFIKQNLRNIM